MFFITYDSHVFTSPPLSLHERLPNQRFLSRFLRHSRLPHSRLQSRVLPHFWYFYFHLRFYSFLNRSSVTLTPTVTSSSCKVFVCFNRSRFPVTSSVTSSSPTKPSGTCVYQPCFAVTIAVTSPFILKSSDTFKSVTSSQSSLPTRVLHHSSLGTVAFHSSLDTHPPLRDLHDSGLLKMFYQLSLPTNATEHNFVLSDVLRRTQLCRWQPIGP